MIINVLGDGNELLERKEVEGYAEDEAWFDEHKASVNMYKSGPFRTLATDVGVLVEGDQSDLFTYIEDGDSFKLAIARLRAFAEEELETYNQKLLLPQRTVFRIENRTSMQGLWYTGEGEFSPVIADLCPTSLSKLMPMGFNELHQKDGKNWFSAGKSVENMREWFSREDAERLVACGYRLYRYKVTEWQELEMEVLFTRESIMANEVLSLNVVWDEGDSGKNDGNKGV